MVRSSRNLLWQLGNHTFVAAYIPMRGSGLQAAIEDILTIAPFPLDNMPGRTNLVMAGTVATFTLT